jgi:methylmalonyl-CoA mutase, C-terminal domain
VGSVPDDRGNSDFRIIIAKPGLDGHDRGAKIVAQALRDAGFQVIYLGLFGTPAGIAEAAMQEDADAVGLSLLSGAHLKLFSELLEELRARGLDDVVVFGGGVIPDEDVTALKALGVGELFTPGASTGAIIEWLEGELRGRRSAV